MACNMYDGQLVQHDQDSRDCFLYAPSQWETTLHCKVISHWLGAYTKWSLRQVYKLHLPHWLRLHMKICPTHFFAVNVWRRVSFAVPGWAQNILGKLNQCHTADDQEADSIQRSHLTTVTSIGNDIVEIKWSYDSLISTMRFPILIRWHLYIESGPWLLQVPGHHWVWYGDHLY